MEQDLRESEKEMWLDGKEKKKKEAKTSDNGQFSRLTTAQEETMEMTRAPNF